MITLKDFDLAGDLVLVTLCRVGETQDVDLSINEMFQLSPSQTITEIAISLLPAYCNAVLDFIRENKI